MEYTPGVVERMPRSQWGKLRDYPASLKAFADTGYELWHLQGVSKGHSFAKQDWATAPLPQLRSVSSATIRAETINADNMARDMVTKGFATPWDVHPASLHAEFAHNTDLVRAATRTVAMQPSAQPGARGAAAEPALAHLCACRGGSCSRWSTGASTQRGRWACGLTRPTGWVAASVRTCCAMARRRR